MFMSFSLKNLSILNNDQFSIHRVKEKQIAPLLRSSDEGEEVRCGQDF